MARAAAMSIKVLCMFSQTGRRRARGSRYTGGAKRLPVTRWRGRVVMLASKKPTPKVHRRLVYRPQRRAALACLH